jgi:hypothetical protein
MAGLACPVIPVHFTRRESLMTLQTCQQCGFQGVTAAEWSVVNAEMIRLRADRAAGLAAARHYCDPLPESTALYALIHQVYAAGVREGERNARYGGNASAP